MKKYTTEELRRFTPDELCEMVDTQEISWSEWVEAQPDTYDGYHGWLEEKGLERCDDAAIAFIREVEDSMMDEEKSMEVEKTIEAFAKYRQSLA